MQSSTFQVTVHGPITRLRMILKLAGIRFHETSAFAIGETLVDCGGPTSARDVVQWLRGSRVNKVVVTHHHEDHAGAGAEIVEDLGIPVMVPEGAVGILADGPRIPLYRRVIISVPRPYRAVPLGDEVDCGEFTLKVIPTPGHAFDHVCFFEPREGWLFTGDLFVREHVPVLRGIENAWQHIRSLERVLALEPRVLVCSSAGFVQDGSAALERKIDDWKDLARRAHALKRRGWRTGRIAGELLGPEGFMTYASLGEYSRRRLIESLLEEE